MTACELSLVAEREALAEVEPAALAAAAPAPPGAWALTRVGGFLPPEQLSARLEGCIGGAPRPDWAEGSDGAQRGQTAVCRVRDVFVAPRFGAVIDGQGRVFQASVGEMLSWTPDLGVLPCVRREGAARYFVPSADAPTLPAASVFMAKGGEFNYGHYLLDCLPSLMAVEELGLARALPPIAPPLKRWHRDLLALAFPGVEVRETRAPLVRVDDLAFATSLDHFLHRPNRILVELRERILAAAPPAAGAKRVYVSRRAYPMRVMVNEKALEAALAARGFTIVRAERLSVAEQIALMRGAEVVVGATGAGLANAMLAPPGAKIVEILPEGFTAPWLRNVVHLTGGDWLGYFCPAPVDPREVSWTYRVRRGFRWGYRLPLADFLKFLDERL